jgi:hypothetical protein
LGSWGTKSWIIIRVDKDLVSRGEKKPVVIEYDPNLYNNS